MDRRWLLGGVVVHRSAESGVGRGTFDPGAPWDDEPAGLFGGSQDPGDDESAGPSGDRSAPYRPDQLGPEVDIRGSRRGVLGPPAEVDRLLIRRCVGAAVGRLPGPVAMAVRRGRPGGRAPPGGGRRASVARPTIRGVLVASARSSRRTRCRHVGPASRGSGRSRSGFLAADIWACRYRAPNAPDRPVRRWRIGRCVGPASGWPLSMARRRLRQGCQRRDALLGAILRLGGASLNGRRMTGPLVPIATGSCTISRCSRR